MEDLKTSLPTLWNPTAAVNWSFLFTPVFGTLIQSYNWKHLGEKSKQRTGKIWFVLFLLLYLLDPFFNLLIAIPEDEPSPWHYRPFAYVFLWYFAYGRSQTKYVKEKFGKNYSRKGWAKPLMLGSILILLYASYVLLIEELFKQVFSIVN